MLFSLIRFLSVITVVYVNTCLSVNDDQPPVLSGAAPAPLYKQIKMPFTNARLLINEVDTSTTDRSKQFVELSKFSDTESKRDRNNDLKKFKLLFITGGAKIVAVCILSGHMFDHPGIARRFFYTIGGDGLTDVSLRFSACQQDPELNGRIPSGKKEPVGLLLLYGDDTQEYKNLELHNGLGITGKRSKLMNGGHLQYVWTHIQDFITYGSTTVYTNCDIFKSIYKHHTGSPVRIVRDWATEYDDEKSINRCGESITPFSPTQMQYSSPTPGYDNDCINGREFVLENALHVLHAPIEVEIEPGELCYIAYTNNDDGTLEISENILADNFEETFTDPIISECNVDEEDLVISLDDDAELNEKEILPTDINDYLQFYKPEFVKTTPHILHTCDHLDQNVVARVSNDIDVNNLLDDNVCPWLDIQENATGTIIASCKFCKPLYEKEIILDRKSSPLLTTFLKTGNWHTGRNRRSENQQMLDKHLNSKLHKIGVQYFTNLDKNLPEREFNKQMLSKDGEYYKFLEPTLNLLAAIYMSVKMNLPFFKFHLFTETLDFARFDTGFLHKGADGARKGLMVMSRSLHQEMLYHLFTKKPLINIILDDSTDCAGTAQSELLFQTFDSNGNVKTYHYALLHLKHGGRGNAIFRVFYDQIKKDKLQTIISDNVIGMTADGARTLQSVFFYRLQSKVKRKLLLVHCHSHKIELVIKNAIKQHYYLSTIDKKVNALHAFFNTKATKRKSILRRAAVDKANRDHEAPRRNFELKRVHPIRWVSHHMSAYKSVLEKWDILIVAITLISDRPDFTPNQRETAKTLLSYLKDATFLAHLAFLADIASKFTRLSLVMQEKNGNLIGKTRIRKTIVTSLDSYAENGGPELLRLLNSATIEGVDDNTHLTFPILLAKFETSNVIIQDVPLIEKRGKTLDIALFKEISGYIMSITAKFHHYFPDDLVTDYFEIFDPLTLEKIEEGDFKDKFALSTINVQFQLKFDLNELFKSWKTCVNSIVINANFYMYKDVHSSKFWLHFLNIYQTECGPQLTEMIKIVLITPGSSASAEQTFSLLTALKTKRRYSLETSTIDAELRIKLNGEKDINKVNLIAYSREFIKLYRRVDDEFRAKPAKKDTNEYDLQGNRLRSIFEKPEL